MSQRPDNVTKLSETLTLCEYTSPKRGVTLRRPYRNVQHASWLSHYMACLPEFVRTYE